MQESPMQESPMDEPSTGATAMHPRITELVTLLDAEREALLAAVERVPADRRDVRPAEHAWSVAELLEHLHRVEKGIARLLEKRVAEARAAGLGPETETSSLIGTLDPALVSDRSLRRVAPAMVEPRGEMTAAAALDALLESRTALRAALLGANGLALSALRQVHLVLGDVDLYQWVLFVAYHERRHVPQMREIGEQLATAG